MKKTGERVGAMLGSTDEVIQFLGFGVYEGYHPPKDPTPVGFIAEIASEAHVEGWTNPRIRLDSGAVVWGCECWWGPEDEYKQILADWEAQGKTVEHVNIDQIRSEHERTDE